MKCRSLTLIKSGGTVLVPALLVLCVTSIAGCGCQPNPANDTAVPYGSDPNSPTDNDSVPGNGGQPLADANQPDDTASQASDLPCIGCHSPALQAGPVVVDASGAGGHSLSGGVLSDAHCEVCHEMTRHRQGRVRLWDYSDLSSVIVLEDDPSRVAAEAEKLVPFCRSCHSGAQIGVHVVDGTWTPACTACHDLHDPTNSNLSLVAGVVHNRTLGVDMPVVFTARSATNSFGDGDPAANDGICQVCHTATRYHLYDGSGTPHNNAATCTDCHPHGAGFKPAGGSSCIACHSSVQGGQPAVVNSDGSGGHHLGGGTLTDADCGVCHEMSQHQQGSVRLWENPNDPSAAFEVRGDPAGLVPFCGACHDSMSHPTTHTVGGDWEPVCTECHEVHNPANANLSLVSDLVHNQTLGQDMPVVFTARTGPGSFSNAVGANDGICQVCHTATAYHLYDGGGAPHGEAVDCTVCHPHAGGFIPVGGTSCTGCHSLAQGGRRPVVDEFGLASHHVQGAPVIDEDCVVCHDMSQHLQGQVRLRDVDDPDNPAAVVSLSADPMSNFSEAVKLEPFCLACHDSDGAGGSAPFSDGLTPPAIDASLWTSASHSMGQTTCMGDGETFGCHGTGHGSAKQRLLAPWDGSQAGVPGDPLREEEGLCYSCHDADGPASTDLEGQFALATRHNVSSLDQTDGSRVECVHCHNPHIASPAALLIDPESGEEWAGSGEAFCLTCHDGAPPAGVSFPPVAPGTGYDKSAFVGSIHDSQMAGSSCRHCHRAHGSDHLAILRERYVVDDYNSYTAGDGDYAACWLCHDEDTIIQQNNAFRNKHRKHVRIKQAPCIICHDAHVGFDAEEPGLIDLAGPVQRGYDIEFIDGRDGSTSFWIDSGENKGYCYIRCHDRNHTPRRYDRTDITTTDCSACH